MNWKIFEGSGNDPCKTYDRPRWFFCHLCDLCLSPLFMHKYFDSAFLFSQQKILI